MPDQTSIDAEEIAELGQSRLKIAVVFAVDKESYLKVYVEPQFAKDMTQEEEDKAAGLMLFITGLVNETRGSFTYLQQKGYELLHKNDELSEEDNKDKLQLDLLRLETKGTA